MYTNCAVLFSLKGVREPVFNIEVYTCKLFLGDKNATVKTWILEDYRTLVEPCKVYPTQKYTRSTSHEQKPVLHVQCVTATLYQVSVPN